MGTTPIKGKIIDITTPISPFMQVFPGDPEPSIEKICTLEEEGFALSLLSMGSHTGTHVDAPSHILNNGLPVDKLELENLIGTALVLDLTSFTGTLTADILEKALQNVGVSENVTILLLKTQRTSRDKNKDKTEDICFQSPDSKFQKAEEEKPNLTYLEESAAVWIVRRGFKTVGIDSFSIDSIDSADLPAHHILLTNKVNVVECLELSSAEEGVYLFLCLPLKIDGCDGAPARAVLISYP